MRGNRLAKIDKIILTQEKPILEKKCIFTFLPNCLILY
jgi:hypothetical protein